MLKIILRNLLRRSSVPQGSILGAEIGVRACPNSVRHECRTCKLRSGETVGSMVDF